MKVCIDDLLEGLMENAASVEIRKSADSHRRLENSRTIRREFPHIFHRPYWVFFS
jgi:hypothetical protein